jgi:multidrug efflux pump
MTLTLVAVYAPLAFTPGRTGRLFIEFALALAGAVVVSGFIALTLSPMMCSLLLKHNPNPSWFDRHMERWLNGPDRGLPAPADLAVTTRYDRSRRRWRWSCADDGCAGSCSGDGALVGIAIVLPGMKRELAPLEDRGQVLAVVNRPDGATLDYTNRYVGAIERMGKVTRSSTASSSPPAIRRCPRPTCSSAPSTGGPAQPLRWRSRARCSPRWPDCRGDGFPDHAAFAGAGFHGAARSISSSSPPTVTRIWRRRCASSGRAGQEPGHRQVDTDLRLNKPEIKIDVDRERRPIWASASTSWRAPSKPCWAGAS